MPPFDANDPENRENFQDDSILFVTYDIEFLFSYDLVTKNLTRFLQIVDRRALSLEPIRQGHRYTRIYCTRAIVNIYTRRDGNAIKQSTGKDKYS